MNTSLLKYAIVRETAAELFEEKLNEKLFEVRDSAPSVEFDSVGGDLVARIKYKKTVEVPETKPSEVGIRFTCGDCPCFEYARNADGSIDRRKKWGGCPYAYMERTAISSPACDVLYNGLRNGDIGLTFKEVEK